MGHKHKFKQIGRGCMINPKDKYCCDTTFKCECGLKFTVLTTKVGHRFLPKDLIK